MANPFIHIELQTQDIDKSKKFYAGMFDWKLEEIPGMDYTIINVGEGTGGGMMKKPVPDMPDNWLPYILVDDIATSTKKAQASKNQNPVPCRQKWKARMRKINSDAKGGSV